jgi:hypothetical protein
LISIIISLPPYVAHLLLRKFIIDKADRNISQAITNPKDPSKDSSFLHYVPGHPPRISTDPLVGCNVMSANAISQEEQRYYTKKDRNSTRTSACPASATKMTSPMDTM